MWFASPLALSGIHDHAPSSTRTSTWYPVTECNMVSGARGNEGVHKKGAWVSETSWAATSHGQEPRRGRWCGLWADGCLRLSFLTIWIDSWSWLGVRFWIRKEKECLISSTTPCTSLSMLCSLPAVLSSDSIEHRNPILANRDIAACAVTSTTIERGVARHASKYGKS